MDPEISTTQGDTQGQEVGLDMGQEKMDMQILNDNIQQVEKELFHINNDNITKYITTLQNAFKVISQSNEKSLTVYDEMFETLSTTPKQLDPINLIDWSNTLGQLSSAIDERRKFFTTPQVQNEVREFSSTQDVQSKKVMLPDLGSLDHLSMCKFMQHRDALDLQRRTSSLSSTQKQILTNYKVQGLIDRVARSQNPTWPLHKIFVRNNRTKLQLTQDQCNYILERISVSNDKVKGKRMPYFNPDFHFQCTIFQVDNWFPVWQGFTNIHKQSQMALPENQGLTEMQVKAKFAFSQGCRWLLFTLDPHFNGEMNERIAFMLANDKTIKRNAKHVARALLSRDAHTGAFDGQHIYYFIDDVEQFMTVYIRLTSQISPLLRSANSCKIIAPTSSTVSSLPKEMADLPPPLEYEMVVPISNSWTSLLKSQLTPQLQDAFSPVIGYGSVYIPQYSNQHFGVLGKVIQKMVKFQHENLEPESLYYWDIQNAQWVKRQSIEQSLPQDYLDYTSYEPPSEEEQQKTHDDTKMFGTQKFDLIRPRQYGSNHYWTLWNRIESHTQITKTPNTIFSEFTYGQNPFQPQSKDDLQVQKLLLCHSQNSETLKDQMFQNFIDKEVQSNIEMAIKYHRLQCIQGYHSPFLAWNKPQGNLLPNRIPTLLEFLSMDLPQVSEQYVRTSPMSTYSWVPKPIIPHVDEETDTYYRSKRDLLQVRQSRLDAKRIPFNQSLPLTRERSIGSNKSNVPTPKFFKKKNFSNKKPKF